MGNVYDALKRADEQRSRRVHDPVAMPTSAELAPERSAPSVIQSEAFAGWKQIKLRLPDLERLRRFIERTDRRRLLGIGVPALLLFVLALLGFLNRSPSVATPTAKVERGDVRIMLTESGELRAAEQTTVSATNDKLITWLVAEGARVKKGDLLIRFESQKYELAKSTAGSMLAVAQADLAKARAEREARQSTEQKALLEYESLPELAEKGYINKSELGRARLAYLEVKAGNHAFDAAVLAARANVDRAAQEVEVQQRKLDEGEVHAPCDGIVVYASGGEATNPIRISVGMIPFEGMPLLYLPDTSNMVVDAEISEFDLGKVHIASRAELRLDAYPEARFAGEVVSIGSLARQKISRITGKPTGLKVFDVRVQVRGDDERLKPGLSTTLDILVSEHAAVLYLPLAAVFLDELDRTVAYRKNGRGVEERVLTLGGSTERIAIVEQGLAEGDEVLLVAPEAL
jgi:RND family efflux transporter MFP subunit